MINKFESINCHQFIFAHKKSFLHVKTWTFSLLVWVGNFLQNVRDGRSFVTSNRLMSLYQRLLAHNLLLNCILLFFYILDQNFLRATSTFLMTERLVGSSPIGISHTALDVSGFPFLRVPFLKEPETCLKNRFYAFLDTQMSGYNLSSILEQVTTASRFPENGEPIRIPKKRNPKRRVDFRFSSSPERETRPGFGSLGMELGTDTPYTRFSTNNWRKLSGLSAIHSMDIH